jgi:hypothetical protein
VFLDRVDRQFDALEESEVPMKRIAITVVACVSLLASSAALAAYQYAPPRQWTPGASAGSTYSPNWLANYFMTYGSGYDKTVTFVRNTNYGWYNTKRGTADYLETYAPFDGTYKAHCVAHTYFWGSCNVR